MTYGQFVDLTVQSIQPFSLLRQGLGLARLQRKNMANETEHGLGCF
jgi:hypothetical protein